MNEDILLTILGIIAIILLIKQGYDNYKKGELKMRTIPFILSMAIQERGTKGKYTGNHWRIKFKDYLKTKDGKNWRKEIKRKDDKNYIAQMLKEIKNEKI
jgi:hypothetical protein